MKKLLLVAGACLLLSGPALAQRNKNDPKGAAAGANSSGASQRSSVATRRWARSAWSRSRTAIGIAT